MNRRIFLNAGWKATAFGIFVPTILRARAQDLNDPAFLAKVQPAAAGGAGIAWNELTQGTSTSDPTTTASITPTANAQVFVGFGIAVAASDPGESGVTVSGCNLTWVQVGSSYLAGDRRRLWVWRGTGASPTTGAITIDYTESGTFQECIYSVDEATSVNSGTPVGTPQSASTGSATALSTPDVGTIDAGDHVYAIFRLESAAAMTPDNGTTLTSIATGANVRSIVVFRNTTDDTPGVTWASADACAGLAFTVEKE